MPPDFRQSTTFDSNSYGEWRKQRKPLYLQGFSAFRVGNYGLNLARVCAPAMVGPDARVGCEPGQVRKEAAISMFSPVPSVARPWAGRRSTTRRAY